MRIHKSFLVLQIILILTCLGSYGQEVQTTDSVSPGDGFSPVPNESLVRNFYEAGGFLQFREQIFLGRIAGDDRMKVSFWVVKYSDYSDSSRKAEGVRILVEEDRKDAYRSIQKFLDSDEIVQTLVFLEKIEKFQGDWKQSRLDNQELLFRSRDRFFIRFQQVEREQMFFCGAEACEFYLECEMENLRKGMGQFRGILEKSRSLLSLKMPERPKLNLLPEVENPPPVPEPNR